MVEPTPCQRFAVPSAREGAQNFATYGTFFTRENWD
jgi:hypothetical protein